MTTPKKKRDQKRDLIAEANALHRWALITASFAQPGKVEVFTYPEKEGAENGADLDRDCGGDGGVIARVRYEPVGKGKKS